MLDGDLALHGKKRFSAVARGARNYAQATNTGRIDTAIMIAA